MKKTYLFLTMFFLFVACSGGSSHSTGSGSPEDIGPVDYNEMDIYPIDACENFADYPFFAYDGNTETYAGVYHPTFDSNIKFIFPDKDLGPVKEQEFWALLNGNGKPVDVYVGSHHIGTVRPPAKGWFCFRSDSKIWTENIRFVCDAGEQLMIYDIYKIVTYEE